MEIATTNVPASEYLSEREREELLDHLPSIEIEIFSIHISVGRELVDDVGEGANLFGQVQLNLVDILELQTHHPHATESRWTGLGVR